MDYPEPKKGLVINYKFLWKSDTEKGLEEGTKARPCMIAGLRADEAGNVLVSVMPITHTPPEKGVPAIELKSALKAHLGLDEKRQWLKTHEINRFTWPARTDLMEIEGGPHRGRFHYAQMPNALGREAVQQFQIHVEQGREARLSRDFNPRAEMDKFRKEMERGKNKNRER